MKKKPFSNADKREITVALDWANATMEQRLWRDKTSNNLFRASGQIYVPQCHDEPNYWFTALNFQIWVLKFWGDFLLDIHGQSPNLTDLRFGFWSACKYKSSFWGDLLSWPSMVMVLVWVRKFLWHCNFDVWQNAVQPVQLMMKLLTLMQKTVKWEIRI